MAPYFVINYDDITGSTDSVTSGKGHASNKLLCVHGILSIICHLLGLKRY